MSASLLKFILKFILKIKPKIRLKFSLKFRLKKRLSNPGCCLVRLVRFLRFSTGRGLLTPDLRWDRLGLSSATMRSGWYVEEEGENVC